jgi:hypothetical protein
MLRGMMAGEIYDTTSVDALKNVKLKYLRIPVDIGLFAGNKPVLLSI